MPDSRFEILIPAGAPAVAIPKETHLAVFRILNNLNATGSAKLIKSANDSWSIYVKVSWSGRVFFGGELVHVENVEINPETNLPDLTEWKNTHVKINLRTGEVTGEDWDEIDTSDLAEYEFYSVATKTHDEDGNDVYTFNSNTVGDIHCRIT